MSKNKKQTVNKTQRHYKQAVAFVVGVLVVIVCYSLVTNWQAKNAAREVDTTVTDVAEIVSLTRSSPQQLRIPAIDLETNFSEPLGLGDDNSIEIPGTYDEVGWYKHGPTPGEIGPAVVLGHVDSYVGPAVFFKLKQLNQGDEIFIDRADGTTAKFKVTEIESHKQSGFPTEKVYSDINHSGLRLITCTGVYDHSILRYTHNLIVFAELVE